MLYDKRLQDLPTEELAVASLRRGMEVGLVVLFGSCMAGLIQLPAALPAQSHEMMPFILAGFTILLGLFGIPMVWIWASTPKSLVRSHAELLAAKRARGEKVRTLSRGYVALLGLVAFGVVYLALGQMTS